MKRMCKTMAALLLCMLLMATATAEGMLSPTPMPLQATPVPQLLDDAGVLSVLPEDNNIEYYRMVRNVVTVGETVYILTYHSMEAQLWRWTADMPHAMKVGGKLLYAHHHGGMAQAASNAEALTGNPDDAAFAVSTILSDGKALYGYNGLNHSVFTITETAEGLAFETIVNLAKIGTDTVPKLPIDACVAGNWLLWHDSDYSQGQRVERLLAFNLETGAVKQAVLPETIKAISSYEDGKALVVCAYSQDVAQRTVYVYDPSTDVTEKLGSLPKGTNARRVGYSDTLGVMVYQDRTRIMGWTPEGVEQIGYMPVGNSYATLYAGGDVAFYTTDDEQIQAVSVRKGYTTGRSITMLGGTMYTVLSQFYNRYQDVPVYYTDQKNGETWQEILSRETEMPDMWMCTNPGSYAEALQAGALLDLSVYPEICEYIEALYPAYRDLAMQNGGIYAVPVYAASYDGWFINKEVMNKMGLTEADVPTTLEGMIAFAQKWNDEWAEKYPHYTLLNETTNYRERFYYAIEAEWKQLCEKAGKPVAYDDPAYVALLEKLDGADFTKLDAALNQTDPEVSEYTHALIWTGVKDVGNFDTYMEDYSDRIFIPLTLTADTPYVTSVQSTQFWVVNARSENGEYCAALLAESIAKLDGKTAYTLRADKTEPVENESFAEELAYQLDYLASLEASVEDSVNKDAALRRVEEQKAYIDNGMNGRRYLINPSAIENYRNVIVPAAYVGVTLPRSLDLLRDVEALEHQYLHREITAQELVTALDALTK